MGAAKCKISATANLASRRLPPANKRMPVPTPQDGDALLMAISSSVISRSVGEVLSHTHTATAAASGNHSNGIAGGTSEGIADNDPKLSLVRPEQIGHKQA